jgi:hypothetical protein
MAALCEHCLFETVSFKSDAIPTIDDIRSNKPMEEFSSPVEVASLESNLIATIEAIDQQMERLREARSEVLFQIQSLKWIYGAPIRRLPTEILQEIFLEYCKERCSRVAVSTTDYDFVISSRLPSKLKGENLTVEMLLTRVCSRWRRIALEMPSLWAIVSPSLAGGHVPPYLERSSQAPLVASICTYSTPGEVLQLLVDQSSRWEKVDVNFWDEEDWMVRENHPLVQIKGNLPTLKHLSYSATTDISLFKNAPRLRSLEYRRVRASRSSSPITVNPNFPWSQIEELVHHPSTHLQFLDALRRCSGLLNVTLRDDHCGMNIIDQHQHPHLPVISGVKSFKAYFKLSLLGHNRERNKAELFSHLLDSIILPNASAITLNFEPCYGDRNAWSTAINNDSFRNFLSHPSDYLSDLSLTGNVRLGKNLLLDILSRLLNLRSLEIQEGGFSTFGEHVEGDSGDLSSEEAARAKSEEWFDLDWVFTVLTIRPMGDNIGSPPTRNKVLLPKLTTLKLIGSRTERNLNTYDSDGRPEYKVSYSFNDDLFINMLSSRSESLFHADAEAEGISSNYDYNCLQSVILTLPRSNGDLELPQSWSLLSPTSQKRILALTLTHLRPRPRPRYSHCPYQHEQKLSSEAEAEFETISSRSAQLQVTIRGRRMQTRFYNGSAIRDILQEDGDDRIYVDSS